MVTALVALLLAAAPPTPRVIAPREVASNTVTVRFVAHERGVKRLRYRCGVDGQRPHACTSPSYPRLLPGIHVFRVQAIDPRGRRSRWGHALITVLTPTRAIKVGPSPVAIAYDGRSVWTADFGGGTATRVDADTFAVSSVSVGGAPGGIAAAGGSVWVGDFTPDGALTRIDPATNTVVGRVETTAQPSGLLGDGNTLWVADYSGGVLRVDAATGQIVARIPIGGNPEALALGFGLLWVSNQDGTISTIDPLTNGVVGGRIAGDDDVDAVAIGDDAVWATSFYGKTLLQIDPVSRRVVRRIPLGGAGGGVVAFAGSVWASVFDKQMVIRVAPKTGALLQRVRVGAGARELVSDGAALWVACQAADVVSRINP